MLSRLAIGLVHKKSDFQHVFLLSSPDVSQLPYVL
jgi:hypothetical protein